MLLPVYVNFLFDGTDGFVLCMRAQTTKRVQARTIACSSSAMLEQHGSTRSSRLARHVERDVTNQVEFGLMQFGGEKWMAVCNVVSSLG